MILQSSSATMAIILDRFGSRTGELCQCTCFSNWREYRNDDYSNNWPIASNAAGKRLAGAHLVLMLLPAFDCINFY